MTKINFEKKISTLIINKCNIFNALFWQYCLHCTNKNLSSTFQRFIYFLLFVYKPKVQNVIQLQQHLNSTHNFYAVTSNYGQIWFQQFYPQNSVHKIVPIKTPTLASLKSWVSVASFIIPLSGRLMLYTTTRSETLLISKIQKALIIQSIKTNNIVLLCCKWC